MGRMEGEGLMVTVIRCWIDDTHEALRAKGKAKEGKEEKKRAAIAKFAANGERFQAMVLQGWREIVEKKKMREQKKGERVQDLMKRMAMEADNLMIFVVREWVSFTDDERRAKFSKKAGKEEKKAAAMARIAGNGERFQAMVLQGWHQRASAVRMKKKKKDERVKDLLQRMNMEAEGMMTFVIREWVSMWMDGKRDKLMKAEKEKNRQDRVKALMNRLALEGDRILATCVRSWVSEWEEATAAKRGTKMGKMDKKAQAIARISGNGERFQQMWLQAWSKMAKEKKMNKTKKDERTKDLLKR